MMQVLGVDSSTSGCKVEVRDAEHGTLLAGGNSPHPPTDPPHSEQDPTEWIAALQRALSMAGLAQHPVAAVAVAAQQHGLVVTDAADDIIRPAKLWNDTESAADSAELIAKTPGGARTWAEACGSVPVASFTISKLAWLRRREPEAFRRIRSIVLPHDWISWQLSGQRATDRGDASGTGYWSPRESIYRLDLLALIDPDIEWESAVPTVLEPSAVAGRWESADALVGPGTGDNMAASLGLGLSPGDIAVSLGTSGTVFTVSETPTADPSGQIAGFADATGRYLPLVCVLNATKVTDAVARLLGVPWQTLDDLALEAPPGADGVTLVPYFDGERTPNLPDATGALRGLRSSLTRSQVARSAFEGVVSGLVEGIGALREAGVVTEGGRLLLVGGGARSSAYRQVLADLTGRPVEVPAAPNVVARGAAVQAAAVAIGCNPAEVAASWPLEISVVIEPDSRADPEALRAAFLEARR